MAFTITEGGKSARLVACARRLDLDDFGAKVGQGQRGKTPDFNFSKDKVGKIFDKAVTRVYMLATEAANAYEFDERERSWADGTF